MLHSSGEIEIITYGGGDLLREVFSAISMLFYGGKNGQGFVHSFCVIAAMIGGAWSISRCFFQGYTDAFLTKYFFPLLVIPTLFIVPQARVHIIDQITDKPIVVDGVPLLFAKLASLSSLLGYEMTSAIEKVMHTPNDVKYCKTGMIFGADTMLDFGRLKLNNATVAQNLGQFAKQCIIYDVALGRYSLNQLRNSDDLFDFLKKNTSQVRMIHYLDPEDSTNTKAHFLTCRESVDKMKPLFTKEVAYYTQHEILKHLPIAFNTLLGFKKNAEERANEQLAKASFDSESTCRQMIAANAINDATSRFAVHRAKDNMRSLYQTAGALAGSSLVTTRIVIEALIYASFALILPLSLLPGGVKFLTSWFFLNIWIQLWPALYAILNYITMLSAQKYASSVMGGISGGYSMFTSAGLQDLSGDIAALGGYLSLSVPVISFYILQNLQSLAHLPSSLLNPVHSASATASTELSTGNYSLANTSIGQFSYDNQSAFQHNTSPTLSTGAFTDNYGTHSVTHGSKGIVVNQNPSNLDTSISIADAYSQQLQNAEQYAKSQTDSTLDLYSETLGTATRNIADLTQHVAQSEMHSTGYSASETQALQESANSIMNVSKSWGEQHGLSGRESFEYVVGAGLNGPVKALHNQNIATQSDETLQEAKNLFSSQDFQEHYQRVLNYANNESINNTNDEGARFTKNYAASMENLQSTQKQYNSASSELNQISENLSYVQSHASTINKNLNTEFTNWLHERGALPILFDKGREQELDGLRDQFVDEKCQANIGELKHFVEPGTSKSSFPHLEDGWSVAASEMSQKAGRLGFEPGSSHYDGQSVVDQYESNRQTVSQTFDQHQSHLENAQHNLKDRFESEHEKSGFLRLNGRALENAKSVIPSVIEGVQRTWFDEYAKPIAD